MPRFFYCDILLHYVSESIRITVVDTHYCGGYALLWWIRTTVVVVYCVLLCVRTTIVGFYA